MINVMLIVPTLNGGGSERVMSILANNLDRVKFKVTLVLLKEEGVYLDDLKENIQIINLNAMRVRHSILKLFNVLKEHNPDFVLSTLGHLNLILALLKYFLPKEIKFIARESSIVTENNKKEKYPVIFNWLYKMLYNRFNYVIAQSFYMANDLISNFKVDREKVVLINNPVEIEKVIELSKEPLDIIFSEKKLNLVAVGRLSKVKAFDNLLHIVSKIKREFHLYILGEGEEYSTLKKITNELNLEAKVTFLGFKKNSYKYMLNADYLLMTSIYEGFPNVVLEAQALGIPVIAFNCPGGISEIVDNDNGILIENMNKDLFSKTIDEIEHYTFDANTIRDSVVNRYSASYIVNKYEKLFKESYNEKN